MSPFTVFAQIIIPIFVLLGLGALLDRFFRLDIQTLTRVNFYLYAPAIVFLKIVNSDLTASEVIRIGGYALIHYFVMTGLAMLVFSLKPFRERRPLLTFASAFYNAGNYGFPLMLLAYGERAVSVIALVLMVQITMNSSVGLLLLFAERATVRESLGKLFKLPILWAVVLGFLVHALKIPLIEQISIPLNQLGDGFIAMALVTLGAQLGRSNLTGEGVPVSAIAVMRLAISPLVALGLVALIGFAPDTAKVLIVGAGLPVAVNVFVIAKEFDHDAGFASQMIFLTTLLSAITIPLLIVLVK